MKRSVDIAFSLIGLTLLSPLLVLTALAIFFEDFANPFYVSKRVGKNGSTFPLFKFRSMIPNADRSKVDSTAIDDPRITATGRIIRACKLDELPQLWNVLLGHMSIVGPRPNVQREVDLYSEPELELLTVKPGVSDFSSIVFADLAEILSGSNDPDIDYNQLVRPWKSRLGVFYIRNHSLKLDLKIISLTALALISRKAALRKVSDLLKDLQADQKLCDIALRDQPLEPHPPLGHEQIVTSRRLRVGESA